MDEIYKLVQSPAFWFQTALGWFPMFAFIVWSARAITLSWLKYLVVANSVAAVSLMATERTVATSVYFIDVACMGAIALIYAATAIIPSTRLHLLALLLPNAPLAFLAYRAHAIGMSWSEVRDGILAIYALPYYLAASGIIMMIYRELRHAKPSDTPNGDAGGQMAGNCL